MHRKEDLNMIFHKNTDQFKSNVFFFCLKSAEFKLLNQKQEQVTNPIEKVDYVSMFSYQLNLLIVISALI